MCEDGTGRKSPLLDTKKGGWNMYTLKINTLLDSDKVFNSFANQWAYEDLYAVDVLDENMKRFMTFSMLVKTYTEGKRGEIYTLENWQLEQPQTVKAFRRDDMVWIPMTIMENDGGLQWLRDQCDIDYDLDFNFETILRYLEGWHEHD